MVKHPRSHKPGSPEPDEALDLLRALARSRDGQQPHAEPPSPQGDEKLDALRALAEKLDLQLRSQPGSNEPGRPPSFPPSAPPLASPAPPLPSRPPELHDVAARDSWKDRIRESLRRESRALVVALPEADSLVPRFGRAQIIHIGISVGVLVIAAIGAIVGPRTPQSPSASQTAAPSALVVPPLAPAAPATDLTAVTRAMSECDAEATKDPNSLHFLVLPLLPGKSSENDWRTLALQEVGNSFLLLSAKDALDGLRDGKLTVRPGRYTFAVLDAASGATYSWTSATSISRLSRPTSQEVKSLKLGFDFSAAQSGAQWSSEFRRDPGACYWVSVLVQQ